MADINKLSEKNKITNKKMDISKAEELSKVLVPELSDIRYREMMTLFNNKPYDEGIVRTEDHTRTYLYLFAFSKIPDEEIKILLKNIEAEYPNLRWAIYLRKYKNRKFISFEPLFPDFLEKDIAKTLADQIQKILTIK